MKGITFGQNATQRGDNIHHQVDANQVIKPENAGFGDAHRAAHQRVCLFNGQRVAHRLVNADLQCKNAHPVAKEAGCIGTAHDALAKHAVVEIGQPVNDGIFSISAADKFQQTHIAHRIEIMGNGKALAEICRHVFDKKADRNGRCIGTDNTVRPDGGMKPCIEIFFDIETFDNCLDDPVAIGKLVEIITDRASGDAAGVALMHQLWRVRRQQPVDGHFRR